MLDSIKTLETPENAYYCCCYKNGSDTRIVYAESASEAAINHVKSVYPASIIGDRQHSTTCRTFSIDNKVEFIKVVLNQVV